MPIKIDEIRNINAPKKHRSLLFKRNTAQQQQPSAMHGNNIMQESHFNPLHRLVLRVLDAMNPIAYKHPKLSARLLEISEKIVSRSDSFKRNI